MMSWSKGKRYRSRLLTYFMAFGTVAVTISMVQYPKEAFDSAIMGLNLWWNVVFPSLLPFFILSEILMGLGVVHFIGVLLEPMMRPLFNVPGVGAFALSMGLASGYPMDAVITCKFRKSQMCSAVEAERLLSFTNTADPLFMFGAVAVGMFGMPELGATIALAHYLSSFLVGIIYRFHGINRNLTETKAVAEKGNILIRAFQALYKAKQADKRSLGELLGDAVKSSMNTIMLIGGFIMLFSVFLRMISVVGLTNYLTGFFATLLHLIGYQTSLASSLVSGLFELDLGAMAASQADAPLVEKVAVASAIIAWSGLSVHGQVASIVIESGIRITPYIFSRLLHAVLAGGFTVLFMNAPFNISQLFYVPAMATMTGTSAAAWLQHTEQTLYQAALLIAIMITLSLICHITKQIYSLVKK